MPSSTLTKNSEKLDIKDRTIITLLDLDEALVKELHDQYDESSVESRLETGQRAVFDKAVEKYLDQVVEHLKHAGLTKGNTTGPQRRKISEKTWDRLGKEADKLDVSRQALLRACLRKFLR